MNFTRWAGARTRAAKVGKGLSKNEKAQKLALRHWLEAIDPRHRYGHNLHIYYDIWFESESSQPFFYCTSKNLYVVQKQKGLFQHSSFLAGGATTAAGRLVAHDGILKAIWPYSGHYLPTEENFRDFICFLEETLISQMLRNARLMTMTWAFPSRLRSPKPNPSH
ncbi:hypothetical protein E3N88_18695 [Mikania micrantha]|uniref:Uncharacterized protein n=1 Tax=Mikania micrantha TaxID=192012 RepID=A0A5N6NMK7_9ASTR|nr:hypothetical protein E3N88_18695 [Mikania micrantha]